MLVLGNSVQRGDLVRLSLDERRQGTYILGTTGTGKSTLIQNIILQDMKQDQRHGMMVLDPHGDLIDDILGLVPRERIDDVILFDPMDRDRPFGLNLLDCDRDDPRQIQWVVSTIMGTLRRLYSYSWGVRLEHVLRHSILTALTIPDSTIIEMSLLLTNEKFREEFTGRLTDPLLVEFWNYFPRNYKIASEFVGSTINKLAPFITDRDMRNIVGQSASTLNLGDIMNDGKILLVNLSKGDLGEENSSLLGAVLVNLVLIAALQRRSIPKEDRRPFHLVVDEFQNFATESFAILQSEARKYAIDVVVAHQYRDQLDDLNKGSTLNVGNMIIFRTTGQDSYELASQFDNTPPPAKKRVEPVYQYLNYQGQEFLTETQLSTNEGKLYREIEMDPRMYSDIEAEMANELSILPSYRAWCRLINVPENRKDAPRLVERQIKTDDLDRSKFDHHISTTIREQSRNMTLRREEVEALITDRTHKWINVPGDDEIKTSEPADS